MKPFNNDKTYSEGVKQVNRNINRKVMLYVSGILAQKTDYAMSMEVG